MPVDATYLDDFKVTNNTDKVITLGDLVNVAVPAGRTIDLLKQPRVNKEKINQSKHLQIALRNGMLSLKSRTKKSKPAEKRAIVADRLLDNEDIFIAGGITNPWRADVNANSFDLYGSETVTFDAEYDNGNASGTMTIDLNNGQKQKVTLTGNCLFSFTAPERGIGNFLLKAINFGDFTPSWTSVLWAGSTEPSWTSSGTDLVGIYYDGTNYYAAANLDFG